MSFGFAVEARDGKARAGRMVTPHGVIETLVFMLAGTLGRVHSQLGTIKALYDVESLKSGFQAPCRLNGSNLPHAGLWAR